MIIGIGSDHGGYELKEGIKEYLVGEGIQVVDFGTDSLESVDRFCQEGCRGGS